MTPHHITSHYCTYITLHCSLRCIRFYGVVTEQAGQPYFRLVEAHSLLINLHSKGDRPMWSSPEEVVCSPSYSHRRFLTVGSCLLLLIWASVCCAVQACVKQTKRNRPWTSARSNPRTPSLRVLLNPACCRLTLLLPQATKTRLSKRSKESLVLIIKYTNA